MHLLAETSTTTWIGWVIGLIIWILIISWTAAIARRKGRSPFLWGLLAFFFSLIPLIVIALMPSKRV
jgi:predicted PurR-regulated permease PerM